MDRRQFLRSAAFIPLILRFGNIFETGTKKEFRKEDYIILETIDTEFNDIKLYVSKTKTFFNNNWYETHESLSKHNHQMLTMRQHADLISLLKSGKDIYDGLGMKLNDSERNKLLKNTIQDSCLVYNVEWLDARFFQENDKIFLFQGHTYDDTNNGSLKEKIVAKSKIPIFPLLKNTYFNLNELNLYGMPDKDMGGRSTHFYYWSPKFQNCVAAFRGCETGGSLECDVSPYEFFIYFGVRPVGSFD